MDSAHTPTSSPGHHSPHRSSPARAIEEYQIAASVSDNTDYHPVTCLSPITEEAPSLPESHTGQSHDSRHGTPAPATPSFAYSPSPPADSTDHHPGWNADEWEWQNPVLPTELLGVIDILTARPINWAFCDTLYADLQQRHANAAQSHDAGPPTEPLYIQDIPTVPVDWATCIMPREYHHQGHPEASQSHTAGHHTVCMYIADMPPFLGDRSTCAMLYLTISGPPFYTSREPGRPLSADGFHRAWCSVAFRPPNERAVLREEGRWDPLAYAFQEQRMLSEDQVYNTDLSGMALAVSLCIDHEEFWRCIRTTYPERVGSMHYVVQWALECPACGEEVVGYASDPLWNGRYIYHQENDCIAREESRRTQHSAYL